MFKQNFHHGQQWAAFALNLIALEQIKWNQITKSFQSELSLKLSASERGVIRLDSARLVAIESDRLQWIGFDLILIFTFINTRHKLHSRVQAKAAIYRFVKWIAIVKRSAREK